MRNINPGSIVFFVILAMIFGQLFSGGFFPVIIAFFIFRSIFSNQAKNPNAPRNTDTRSRDYRQDRRYRPREQSRDYRRESVDRTPPRREAPTPPKAAVKNNPFKKTGVEKFKDYDYEGAIEDFQKALQVDGKDKAVHFNIACAYSLMEDKDKAYYHLSKAVEYGLVDFEKIKTHDALAYLRIQEEFETFAKSGYHWPLETSATTSPQDQVITGNPDILEQLKQLGELRDRGLLTQEEFLMQKEKLMR